MCFWCRKDTTIQWFCVIGPMLLGIIPARYASTRFPGKPLVPIQGISMIQRVYEQAKRATALDHVIVATDDARIFDHVRAFGGEVVMTNADHPSGTDRCAEVATQCPAFEAVLNIQGDEPFVRPEQIDLLAHTLLSNPACEIATLAKKIEDPQILFNPNAVKVVFAPVQGALYFSRNPIPYVRGADPSEWLQHAEFYKHIGLYAYRRDTLLRLSSCAPSPLERAESLEQLRWLENGYRIAVGLTEWETLGVDTPEDLRGMS